MEGIGEVGLEQLLATLVDVGAGDMALPVDNARHLARLTLQGARQRGWSFDDAWAAAMNRLQPSQAGGEIDEIRAAELREDRQLLEEDRPLFRAAFEGRAPTPIERGQRLAAVSGRVDSVLRPPPLASPSVAIPARAA